MVDNNNTDESNPNDTHRIESSSKIESESLKEEPPRDAEGLLLKYDVIVCGTGLVQSIVASALARAGKTVLHVDGAGYYGELDAVWSYDVCKKDLTNLQQEQDQKQKQEQEQIQQSTATQDGTTESSSSTGTFISLAYQGANQSFRLYSNSETIPCSIHVGTLVKTPYGTGTVERLEVDKLVVRLTSWKLAHPTGSYPMAYFSLSQSANNNSQTYSLESDLYMTHHHIESMVKIQALDILGRQSRYLALDASPALVLASGKAVQGMLASGVAEYVEFKTAEGLLWLEHDKLSRVPCTKGDVFSTKLLAPMDKRRLMKFLQLSFDYATKVSYQEEVVADTEETPLPIEEAEEVQSLNERHLNQGRSLARPQNKAVSTQEMQLLQDCMDRDDSFEVYLRDQQKLSPGLISMVRYALAMETTSESTSLREGMNRLRHHLQALGRYGTTAFLVPMYGSGELSQAFCRSAAVFGATYLLRRAPIRIELKSPDGDAGTKVVAGVVLRGDQSNEGHEYLSSLDRQDKHIQCSQVVVSAESLVKSETMTLRPTGRVLRRISVLNGKLIISDKGEQRHVIIIPPMALGKNQTHAIHGLVLDESVQVAPPGCTILHLTTTTYADTFDDQQAQQDDSILAKACHTLLSLAETGSLDEIYHLSFSHEVFSDAIVTGKPLDTKGLHICHHSGQVLAADAAFEQAQKIFLKICPGMEFLGLSEEMDTVVKERAAERWDEDDERYMLDTAVGLIGQKTDTDKMEPEASDFQSVDS